MCERRVAKQASASPRHDDDEMNRKYLHASRFAAPRDGCDGGQAYKSGDALGVRWFSSRAQAGPYRGLWRGFKALVLLINFNRPGGFAIAPSNGGPGPIA
jgi:hypothetical protein